MLISIELLVYVKSKARYVVSISSGQRLYIIRRMVKNDVCDDVMMMMIMESWKEDEDSSNQA